MKKVLVAEDESSIREFVVINLKRNGYMLSKRQTALRLLKNTKPATAILMLPSLI